jgi:hypothetical protein
MSEKNKNVLKRCLDYVSIVHEGYVIQKLENNLVHIESVKKSKILEGIIMKKKNLATAMAAAMTLGAVAPVVANAAAVPSLDVRSATTGYKLKLKTGETFSTYTRAQAFNTNFTDEISDDTLKFANTVIVKEFAGIDNNMEAKADNTYVLAEKESTENINVAKAKLAVLETELTNYANAKNADGKAKYTITEAYTDVTDTADSTKVVTVKEGTTEVATYTFTGVKFTESADSIAALRNLFTGITDVNNAATIKLGKTLEVLPATTPATYVYDKAEYLKMNKVNYILEANKSKFDVVNYEVEAAVPTDLTVKVYKKGADQTNADNLVATFTLNDVKTMNKDLLITMPAKTDVDGTWSEKQVKEAMLNGYVVATSEFAPKREITRGEFAKILCNVFELDTSDKAVSGKTEPFHDVTEGQWFYNYVVALNEKGLIQGYGNKETFAPNVKITRQEAAKMVAAAYDKQTAALSVAIQDGENTVFAPTTDKDGIVETIVKINNQDTHRDMKTTFADDAEIASWADESAEALKLKGILVGTPDKKLNAKSNITREEALVMLVRAGQ